MTSVPYSVVDIIQGLVILFIIAAGVLQDTNMFSKRRRRKSLTPTTETEGE
jgi:ABC-type uncharacterized transport system permease subunit